MVTNSPLLPPPSPWFMQPETNFNLSDTNEEEFKARTAFDTMEVGLLNRINEIKTNLSQPALPPSSRGMLEHLLGELRWQLANHRAMVQSNQAFAQAIRANPKTAWTNMPDPIEQSLSMAIARNERILADPTLDPNNRRIFEHMLEDSEQKLADHETNAQLWTNLRLARASKDTERITHAETELATYLADRLGKIQGKKYPPGMSLDAIMEEYKKQAGDYHWYDSRIIIRTIVFVVFIVPPLAMIFFVLKKVFFKIH